MLQRWQAVGNSVSDLTGLSFEPQTYRSRDERVTARPTGRYPFKLCFRYKTAKFNLEYPIFALDKNLYLAVLVQVVTDLLVCIIETVVNSTSFWTFMLAIADKKHTV